MSGVLVVAEARRGELRDVTFELIAAGKELAAAGAGPLSVAIVDGDPSRYRDRLALEGVDAVLAVKTPNEHFEPHVAQSALEGLIAAEQPSVVVLGHSIDSLGFAPAVAARGGHGFASDVTKVSWEGDGPVVGRSAFAGKLVAELDFPGRDTVLLLLRVGTFEPAEVGGGSPEWRDADVQLAPARSEHVEFREVDAGDVDITKADFLLSVGRGIEDKDNLDQFEELADKMGATLSVSRPLVDAGWVTNARQVGQSGKTVKPKVYLALGISGAVQHLAGMRGADTIIAVNTDPEAPIFSVAHYGAVADLFDVAEQLEQQAD
jgi:electron transfer flavoprotein alpha subunit